ncbi:winged helix DNA-binding domain-containing protein [Hortaea werneckii]|nr:winged helix DNA-binding domain-containing protein [Hortaea werneckii]KAI7070179.1 winged helix DNA-binding domain-containing protein [Hortaea werneckii]KAI7203268.1 winged helix DNA-binding domain-containing protein [Hortaea werneckii]KAI7300628.1 winged helix DNA-binding domain-containing protein [Hortaea werneckii]KAI7368504.1 winged helix DNA-binding domain-containing protein [Hortaea werneckii]
MAETAQDAIPATDVPEKEVSNVDNAEGTIASKEEKVEKLEEQEQVIDGERNATADGKSEEKKDDAKDDQDNQNDNASQSPYSKRKDRSEHDRYDNKRGRGGGRGRGGRGGGNYNRNRARFEDQPESKEPDEIRSQVEFYFSDSNLPIDAYLLGLTGGSENRPVPLKLIHSFKRMRHFQPFSAVRDAIKESKFLELNDSDEITRKTPLADKFTDDAEANKKLVHSNNMNRSIYAKGFGEEHPNTHLDIENFFQPYGTVNAVRLRRKDDGEFKGSVFVEFGDEETQKGFLELDPKPQFDGKDLQVMSKQAYVDTKREGILDGDVKPKSQSSYYRGRGRGGGGKKDSIDRDDWNKRRDRDQGGRGRGRGRGRGGRGRGGGRDNRRSNDDRADAEGQGNDDISGPAAAAKKRAREDDGETAGGHFTAKTGRRKGGRRHNAPVPSSGLSPTDFGSKTPAPVRGSDRFDQLIIEGRAKARAKIEKIHREREVTLQQKGGEGGGKGSDIQTGTKEVDGD